MTRPTASPSGTPKASPIKVSMLAWVTTTMRACRRVIPSTRKTASSCLRRRTAVASAWPQRDLAKAELKGVVRTAENLAVPGRRDPCPAGVVVVRTLGDEADAGHADRPRCGSAGDRNPGAGCYAELLRR